MRGDCLQPPVGLGGRLGAWRLASCCKRRSARARAVGLRCDSCGSRLLERGAQGGDPAPRRGRACCSRADACRAARRCWRRSASHSVSRRVAKSLSGIRGAAVTRAGPRSAIRFEGVVLVPTLGHAGRKPRVFRPLADNAPRIPRHTPRRRVSASLVPAACQALAVASSGRMRTFSGCYRSWCRWQ